MLVKMILTVWFFMSPDLSNHIVLSRPVVAMYVKLNNLYVFTENQIIVIDTSGKIATRCRLAQRIGAVYSFGKDFYYTSFKRYVVGKFTDCSDIKELKLGDAPGITLDVKKVLKIMYDYQNFKPYFLGSSMWMWSNRGRLYRISLDNFSVKDSLILEDSINFITMNERFLIKTFDSGVSIIDRVSQKVCFFPLQGIIYTPVLMDSLVFLITGDSCLILNLNDCRLIKTIQESDVNIIKKYNNYYLFFKYNPVDSRNSGVVLLDRDFKVIKKYKLKVYPPFPFCSYGDTLILGAGCGVFWIDLQKNGNIVDSLRLCFRKRKVSFLEKVISSITSSNIPEETVISQICKFNSFLAVSGGEEVYLIKR